MKPQHFAALAACALASLLIAITAYTAAAPWQAAVSQGPLFSGFTNAAQKVTRMEVSQGSNKLTLERKGDNWTLSDRDGYPANAEKVRSLLTGLTVAELVEPKTRKKERYTELEVEDPTLASANSNLVKLSDDGGNVVAELIIGKQSKDAFGAARAGTFVRKPADDLSWLVNASLEAKSDLKDWVKPRIFETQPDKIRKVRIEIPGEQPLESTWDAASKRHKLTEVPKGKRVKYANTVDEISEALATVDLEDVRKATASPPATDPVQTAVIEIDGGLKVTFKVRKSSDGDWLTLTATGEGEPKKFADDLTAAVKDWEFRIPKSKVDDMFKTRKDILEDDTVDTMSGKDLEQQPGSAGTGKN